MDAQTQVVNSVRERGYRDKWSDVQFLTRQIAKLQEELGELAEYIEIPYIGRRVAVVDLGREIQATGEWAGVLFSDKDSWNNVSISKPVGDAVEKMKKELADCQVVIFNIADVLGSMSGISYDVVSEAVIKSNNDIKRGVRGKRGTTG